MDFYERTKPTQCSHFVADNVLQIRKLEMLTSNELTFPSPAKKAIILHGKYGTGKTELAKLLPRMIEKHRVPDLTTLEASSAFDKLPVVNFVSCSVDNLKRAFDAATPSAVSFNPSKRHYVVLDEVDNLRSDYQKSLKSFITQYDHVIHIMTTNHINDVDAGLCSRSHLISFENPDQDLWLSRCVQICEMFDVAPDERYLKNLIRVSRCDARKIMSALEEYVMGLGTRAA